MKILENSCKNKQSLKYNFKENYVHFSEKSEGMSLYRKKKVGCWSQYDN